MYLFAKFMKKKQVCFGGGGRLLPVKIPKQIGSFSCDTLSRLTPAPLYLCSAWCVDPPLPTPSLLSTSIIKNE